MIQTHLHSAHGAFARIALILGLAALPLVGPAMIGPAMGQSGNGWFVPEPAKPGSPGAGAPGAAGRPQAQSGAPRQTTPDARLPPAPVGPVPVQPGVDTMVPMVDPGGQLPPLQAQLPPMPEIPSIAKGPATPAAIIGILSIPDILRVSSAYQMADKELAARRTKVNDDGQKEQNTLRDLGQAFANERAKLTPEQIRAREKEYADRVNESRRKFSERARTIQEAGQYVMAQIERVIEQVAQQVAASRGVNLVLNRSQVLGTTADFDLTPQVAEVLNRVLPAVVIPPDGRSEEHTSELQSPKQISYAVFCLRSEERRVGKECPSKCRSRWSPYH